MLDFNYIIGVISKNEKLKTNVVFLFHVALSNISVSMLVK